MADIIQFPKHLENKRPEEKKPNFALRRTIALGMIGMAGFGGLVAADNKAVKWITEPIVEAGERMGWTNGLELPDPNDPHKVVVVKSSDTRAWDIAAEAYPERDPREVIDEIIKPQLSKEALENGYDLYKGEEIILPVDANTGELVDSSKQENSVDGN